MNEEYKYPGEELSLFNYAKNWKKYFAKSIKKYIKGKVLEVGAGIGNNTLLLNDGTSPYWLLLEPDGKMASGLEKDIAEKKFPYNCSLIHGTVSNINQTFDTIIYIDVLEHIEDDAEELKTAATLLNPNGYLVVLSPAFQHIYSPFDKSIGHYRRYNRKMVRKITPPGIKIESCRYYDSIGYFASLMNKIILKQKMPKLKQIFFWDRYLLPVLTVTDKLFLHSFGKSIIVVWKK